MTKDDIIKKIISKIERDRYRLRVGSSEDVRRLAMEIYDLFEKENIIEISE